MWHQGILYGYISLDKGFCWALCISELVSTACLSLLGGPAKRESSFHMSAFTLAFCLRKYYSAIFHPDIRVYMNWNLLPVCIDRCLFVLLRSWTTCGSTWWGCHHTSPFICWTVSPVVHYMYMFTFTWGREDIVVILNAQTGSVKNKLFISVLLDLMVASKPVATPMKISQWLYQLGQTYVTLAHSQFGVDHFKPYSQELWFQGLSL